MITGFVQRLTSVAAWGGLSALFGMLVGAGATVLGALILAAIFAVIAVMLGPQFLAASWLVGSPTVFGFPNQVLRALPFVTMERLLLVTLAAMVFLRYAFSKQKTKWLPLETTILVFLVYALVNMALHTDIFSYKRDGWLWTQYLMPMAGFIVSRRIEWSEQGLKILLLALTLAGVFLAFVGVMQSFFGVNLFTMNYQSITVGHEGRAYGTFSSAHTYVSSLFIFLSVTLLQYCIYSDRMIRLLLVFAMGVIAVGMILGISRAPLIGAALAFAIIFVKHPGARPLLLVGGLIVFSVAMVFFVVMADQLGGIVDRISNIGTLLGRFAAWATALNMIADHPLFGAGFGVSTYAEHKAEYITGIGSLTAQYAVFHGVPHNEYLQVAVMLGVIGLVLFLMILVRLVRLMFRVFRDPKQTDLRRHLALYSGAIVIALMFNSFFSDTYTQDYFWVLAYFLAGIAAGNLDQSTGQAANTRIGGGSIESAGK